MRAEFWVAVAVAASAGAAAAAEVRDFAPDRPSRSDSPITVARGFFQLETDFASYTDAGDQLQTLDPTIKYGISDRVDGEVQLGGLVTQAGHQESFGDVVIRLKLSLLGDDGGGTAIALIPYVKAPTARQPVGNGQVEGGVNAPILFSLPYDVGLTVEPEIAVLKNALNTGRQVSFTGIINAGHRIVGDLNGFVEVYGQAYADRATAPQVTFDTGLSYAVMKTLQLDLGASVGLNHATPGVNLYSGVAVRF